jgi:glutamine cyclotransferase
VRARLLVPALAAALTVVAVACSDDDGTTAPASTTPMTTAPTSTVPAGTTAGEGGAGEGEAGAGAGAGEVERLTFEVVATVPHDPTAFTQGLVLAPDGRLFESTGLYAQSQIRELDPTTGEVLARVALEPDLFGEGLALVDDRLVQLTWREEVALVWQSDDLAPLDRWSYEGEGWGLCDDGTRLVHSDGTARLRFRERTTFAEIGAVDVTLEGRPVEQLNELECVDGDVWANVWQTDEIVRIDPTTGTVTGVLDLAGLLDPGAAQGADVLNGIAHRPDTGTFLVTGKLWPTLFELRVTGPGTPG